MNSMKLYTLYDVLAKEAGEIFMMKNDDVAIRSVHRMFIEKGIPEEDFELYCVGEFNTEECEITTDKRKIQFLEN